MPVGYAFRTFLSYQQCLVARLACPETGNERRVLFLGSCPQLGRESV